MGEVLKSPSFPDGLEGLRTHEECIAARDARLVVTKDLLRALRALAEGYFLDVRDDRYIIIHNPDFQPDNGSAPNLVIDVDAYQARSAAPQSLSPSHQESENEIASTPGALR